ncbi:hypothetical protein KQX54_016761 [Cotesia glomerata]|uniref:Uncharacterized protein n=1 Tax=Cotesia glomerata TaxID=32391 RepID=A0AAV7INT4_COTGL|nr:hypothetical protein KQX54_016761 [Cotesia glomerata]
MSCLQHVIASSEVTWGQLNAGMDLGRERYSMREFMDAVVNRIDIREDIAAATSRRQCINNYNRFSYNRGDDLSEDGELLSIHFEVVVDEVSEYEHHDKPIVSEWIQATLEKLVFDDRVAENVKEACLLCQTNQRRAAFALCGHFSVCLRRKHGMDI